MEAVAPARRPNPRRWPRGVAASLMFGVSVAVAVGLPSLASGRRHVAAYSPKDHAKALDEFAAAQRDEDRYYALADVAKTTVYFGTLDQAQACAEQLLEMAGARKRPGDWNYGNAVHDGHEVLGLVALRRGAVEEAKWRLLLAGETPGSPQLDTFGPNMLLAKELLEHGETSTVIAYFAACRRFWEMHGDRLDRWTKDAREGREPDFGANLLF